MLENVEEMSRKEGISEAKNGSTSTLSNETTEKTSLVAPDLIIIREQDDEDEKLSEENAFRVYKAKDENPEKSRAALNFILK